MSEDKGGFFSSFSGLFRKKESPSTSTSQPVEQPTPQTPDLPSAQEDRAQRMEQRNQRLRQAGYQTTVEAAQSGLSPQSPIKPVGTELQNASQQVAARQSAEMARKVQEVLTPKETDAERFKRLTKDQPKPMFGEYQTNEIPEEQVNTAPPATPEQPVQSADASPAKKGVNLEPYPLDKTPATEPNEKKTDSVPPFVSGSFPGVDKWQPGEGAIKGDVLDEVIKEVDKKYRIGEPKKPEPEKPILDAEALKKSLKTPTSEWGRKSPGTKQAEELKEAA